MSPQPMKKTVKRKICEQVKPNVGGCAVCGQPYNYEGTGLCGPCCTGEAETVGEGEYTGGCE